MTYLDDDRVVALDDVDRMLDVELARLAGRNGDGKAEGQPPGSKTWSELTHSTCFLTTLDQTKKRCTHTDMIHKIGEELPHPVDVDLLGGPLVLVRLAERRRPHLVREVVREKGGDLVVVLEARQKRVSAVASETGSRARGGVQ